MEGSNRITLLLSSYNVLMKVQTNSYYTGEARKEDVQHLESGTRIQTSQDEEDILGDYLSTAVDHLHRLLGLYLGETACMSQSDAAHEGYILISFTVQAPANFVVSRCGELERLIEDEATYLVLRDWLGVMKPGEEAFAVQKAQEAELNIRYLVTGRTKPAATL